MSKSIKSNTTIFIIIIAFVKIFEAVFGRGNTLVGVSVIVAAMVFMQEDLTENPVENFMKLLIMNLLLGIFAHISSYNIWIGLILNFAALSAIGYLLSYNLNKVMIVPFGLEYLFMLYAPTSGGDFAKRLLALSFGAVIVMAVQFIVHREKTNAKAEENKPDEDGDVYSCIKIFGRDYRFHTVRAAYAIRVGFITAITIFAVAFLNLKQGRWVVFTIFSLTEIYSENCRIRSKQRLEGTIVGVLIVALLFMFIKNNTIRGLLVLLGGYLDTYTTNYRDKMICVTVSAVASVSIINGTLITAIERVGYVFIGVILALLVDKLILRQKLGDFGLAE